jgi:hypothetical protein
MEPPPRGWLMRLVGGVLDAKKSSGGSHRYQAHAAGSVIPATVSPDGHKSLGD